MKNEIYQQLNMNDRDEVVGFWEVYGLKNHRTVLCARVNWITCIKRPKKATMTGYAKIVVKDMMR